MARAVTPALLLLVNLFACGRAKDAGEGQEGPCGEGGPSCRRNTLVTCGDAGPVEIPCDPGRCAFDAPVPQCVPAGALPCDPAAAEPACENGLLVSCTPETAYTLASDCGEGQICSARIPPAKCVEVSAEPCVPTTFQPICAGGRRVECESRGRHLVETGRCAVSP